MPRYQPTSAEKLCNMQQFGEVNPYDEIKAVPVYTVTLRVEQGTEVRLSYLRTYEHAHTGEKVEKLCSESESKFIFDSDWPDDGIIRAGGTEFRQLVTA